MTNLYKKGAHCAGCPLRTGVLVPGRWARGAQGDKADVVLVGEGPGRFEVAFGKAFVGPSGELLDKVTRGLNLGNVYLTNTALCQVEGDKDKAVAAKHCRERLFAELCQLQPRIIVALGNVAMMTLLSCPSGITKRRGVLHDVVLNGKRVPVMPTFHPAAVLRNPGWYTDLRADLSTVATLLEQPKIDATSRRPIDVSYTVTHDVGEVFRAAERGDYAVLDLETEGLDWTRHKILCAVIATAQGVYIVPQDVVYGEEFKRRLRESRVAWSGHNAKFDRNFVLAHLGVPLKFKFDTMLASYLLDERGGIHSLKDIARRMYDAPDWEAPIQDALKGKVTLPDGGKRNKHYGDIPRDTLFRYAAQDGHYQYKLTWDLAKQIVAQGRLRWVFENLLMPATDALSNAEVRGVQIDVDYLRKLRPEYERRCDALTRKMVDIIGHDLNPRSPVQVAKVIFDELGVPQHHRFGRSTNWNNVLMHHRDVPFVALLGDFRKADKLLSTYVKGLLKYVDAQDPPRVHTTYKIHGTVTGRLSSEAPNMQNIPRDVKDIKRAFVASPEHLLIYADFSQIELRMLAWFSRDEWLMQVYRDGRDLHGEMAEVLFGEDYTPEQRSFAKRLNFGQRLQGRRKTRSIAGNLTLRRYGNQQPGHLGIDANGSETHSATRPVAVWDAAQAA